MVALPACREAGFRISESPFQRLCFEALHNGAGGAPPHFVLGPTTLCAEPCCSLPLSSRGRERQRCCVTLLPRLSFGMSSGRQL
jgi:hypothetical protein